VEFGLAYLFIAHDLSVVRHISHRIAVMYLGEIVETARSNDLFERPLHPYTQALLSAVPVPDPTHERSRIMLEGDVPTPINPPSGCHFHPRCRLCEEVCKQEPPGVTDAGEGHTFRCHVAARDFPESATTPVQDPYPHP
jgi:oligopeptide/dipeptide ABC transporter ATP-binding protein